MNVYLMGAETQPTQTENQLRLLRTVTFPLLFCRSILHKQLEEIQKRTSCTKILKKKLTVDGGMAVQIPLCGLVWCSPSPTDTYRIPGVILVSAFQRSGLYLRAAIKLWARVRVQWSLSRL